MPSEDIPKREYSVEVHGKEVARFKVQTLAYEHCHMLRIKHGTRAVWVRDIYTNKEVTKC
jgi:hypothetical protein